VYTLNAKFFCTCLKLYHCCSCFGSLRKTNSNCLNHSEITCILFICDLRTDLWLVVYTLNVKCFCTCLKLYQCCSCFGSLSIANSNCSNHSEVPFILFICGIYIDTISSIDYIAWNDKVINEWWIGKDMERSNPSICLLGLRKLMRNLVRIAGLWARIWTWDLCNRKRVLTSWTCCSIAHICI
jgi:hypothetical protein